MKENEKEWSYFFFLSFYGRQALPGYAKLELFPYKLTYNNQVEYKLKSDVHIISNGGLMELESKIEFPTEVITLVRSKQKEIQR